MIKTIIFDFGNVFIDLNMKKFTEKALELFEIESFTEDILAFNNLYEIGAVSTGEFLNFYRKKFPELENEHIIDIWNLMLKGFPEYRLDFLKQLRRTSDYKLVLLSNTNELHIKWIEEHISFYETFKNCFDAFYLSHEIGLRKPEKEVFEYVLNKNRVQANECLFIDDVRENTEAADQLNIHTWNLKPGSEDIIDLFKIKSDLF